MRLRGSSPSSRPDGCRALGQATEGLFPYRTYRVVLTRICPGYADFLPFRIGVAGQVHQSAEVIGGLLAITCGVGRPGGSPERAEAIGRLL